MPCAHSSPVCSRSAGFLKYCTHRREAISRRKRQRTLWHGNQHLQQTTRARLCRPQAKTERAADPATSLDTEQFPFATPKQAKFQPFIGESDLRNELLAFRRNVEVLEGELLIRPMVEGDIQAATDLLAGTFADAVGCIPTYRTLLNHEVQTYLRSHISIAPKAVILAAVLRPSGEDSDKEDESASLVPFAENHVGVSNVQNVAGTDDASAMTWSGELEHTDSQQLKGGPGQSFANPLQPKSPFASSLNEALRTIDGEAASARPESSFREASKDDVLISNGLLDVEQSSMDGYSSFSDEKAQSLRGSQPGTGAAESSWVPDEAVESSTDEVGSEAQSVALEKELEEHERQESLKGKLVGTVELSFSPATRVPSLTLNPPKEGAYLCNMAIACEYQRRGFGSRLLRATEEVIQLAGFRRVYLHVRLKDEAARRLYRKADFQVEKEDCMLVSLWDHRRQLLSKFTPRKRVAALPPPEPEMVQPVQTEY